MLTRSGAKVWLAALEDIIKQNDNVFDCCCVKLNDKDEREVPVAHIVFKDVSKAKQSIEEIDNAIKACQPLTYVPKYYILKDEIPVTKVNNKIDFKTLEKENILDSNDYDIKERLIKPKTLKL
jgi:acyl-CoA synthetase (AMP-forming)/AMP-acid ligase II